MSLAMSELRITTSEAIREPQAAPGPLGRAVAVFDLDGTLVDTAPDLAASVNHCLALAGLPGVPEAVIRPHSGFGARAMLTLAFGRSGLTLTDAEMDAQLACFLSYYEDHIADRSQIFPGVAEALDRLEADGFVLAVCTNKTERLARLLCETMGLAPRFKAVCGADTFQRRKPDPIHLLGTIERCGGDPRASVMIGDSRIDMDAAWASGVRSILVEFGDGVDAGARAAAGRVVSSYAQIDRELLENLLHNRAGAS